MTTVYRPTSIAKNENNQLNHNNNLNSRSKDIPQANSKLFTIHRNFSRNNNMDTVQDGTNSSTSSSSSSSYTSPEMLSSPPNLTHLLNQSLMPKYSLAQSKHNPQNSNNSALTSPVNNNNQMSSLVDNTVLLVMPGMPTPIELCSYDHKLPSGLLHVTQGNQTVEFLYGVVNMPQYQQA